MASHSICPPSQGGRITPSSRHPLITPRSPASPLPSSLAPRSTILLEQGSVRMLLPFLLDMRMMPPRRVLRPEGTRMSQPINRTVSLSPARRLVCDVMHFSKKVPIVVIERRLNLAEVANARSAARDRPSLFALFVKAYGIIA